MLFYLKTCFENLSVSSLKGRGVQTSVTMGRGVKKDLLKVKGHMILAIQNLYSFNI